MEWDGGSRVQTYLSILCFDAQFSRKGSAGFRFAASQVVSGLVSRYDLCYNELFPARGVPSDNRLVRRFGGFGNHRVRSEVSDWKFAALFIGSMAPQLKTITATKKQSD